MTAADFQPIIDWLTAHPNWVIISVLLISFVESLAIAGIIVPGVLLLFLVATLAGHLGLPIWPLLLSGFVGALLGDGISFVIGQYYKESLHRFWPFSKYPKTLSTGKKFFIKHGGKSILFGRFIGPVRPVVPLVAGMLGMSQVRFTFFNALSALAWAPSYILPGYFTGSASNLTVPEHFFSILISIMFFVLLIGVCIKYLSINLQTGKFLYETTIKALSQSGIEKLFRIKILNKARSALPVAACFLFMLSITLFVIWSFLSIQTDLIKPIDALLLNFSQVIRTDFTEKLFLGLTLLGDKYFMYSSFTVLVVTMFALRKPIAATHIMLAGLTTSYITHSLKLYFAVPRPSIVLSPPESFAFPSGHSTASTVLYGLIATFVAQGRIPPSQWRYYLAFSLPILLIASSRIFLGVHWFSDVIGGLLLGLVISSLTLISYAYLNTQILTKETAKVMSEKASFRIILLAMFTWGISAYIYQNIYVSESLNRFQLIGQIP